MNGQMATKNEKNALNKIAELGCILCAEHFGIEGSAAELHHVRRFGAVRATSPILPLCPEHQRGNSGLHGLGVKGFERKYQISCEELLERVSQKLGKDIE
jgi:hypothetical protein